MLCSKLMAGQVNLSDKEWATVMKKKGNKISKVVMETKISQDLFIVGVLDQCYLGDPFEVTRSMVGCIG